MSKPCLCAARHKSMFSWTWRPTAPVGYTFRAAPGTFHCILERCLIDRYSCLCTTSSLQHGPLTPRLLGSIEHGLLVLFSTAFQEITDTKHPQRSLHDAEELGLFTYTCSLHTDLLANHRTPPLPTPARHTPGLDTWLQIHHIVR